MTKTTPNGSCEIQRVRLRRAYRNIQRSFPDAQRAPRGTCRWRTEIHRQVAGAGASAGSDVGPAIGTTPDVQRVLRRRRRYRPAGLRELRHSRGLRNARAPRNFGERRDRYRALWSCVARHQAQSCRRTWRGWLHHLFRSARRWLLGGRNVIRKAGCGPRRRAARQRAGLHRIHGRPADAQCWRDG